MTIALRATARARNKFNPDENDLGPGKYFLRFKLNIIQRVCMP